MATKKKTSATDATVRVRALSPIRADGVDYAPDEEFDIDEISASGLVDGGWAEVVSSTQSA